MSGSATNDLFFGGALAVRQPAKGHRIGTDAVLLAASCPQAAAICDLGAGAGAVGLRAAQIWPLSRVELVEIAADCCALARENAVRNGLEARVAVHQADVLARGFGAGLAPVDVVLTNPPFADQPRGRLSPDADRRRAHAMAAPLEDWLKAGLRRLKPKGRLVVVHRADALARLLAALEGRAGDIRLRFVHPRAGSPAHRVLVSARLQSRAPLAVLPALALHDASGAFTPDAEAIHRGAAPIPWD